MHNPSSKVTGTLNFPGAVSNQVSELLAPVTKGVVKPHQMEQRAEQLTLCSEVLFRT